MILANRSWDCFFGAVLTGLLVGCSSLPSKEEAPESVRAKQAVDDAKLGDSNLANHNYLEAQKFYNQSLNENYAIDNLPGIAEAQDSLATVALAMRDYPTAEKQFAVALAAAELTGLPELTAKVLSNQAKMRLYQDNPTAALTLLARALALLKTPDSELAAVILHNQGVAYDKLGQATEALAAFQKALGINTAKKQLRESASNNFMLASLANKQGNSSQALALLDTALNLDKTMENPDGIAADLYALYRVNAKLGNTLVAYHYLERSFRVSLMANDETAVRQTLPLLRDLAAANQLTDAVAVWQEMLAKLESSHAP